MGKRVRAFSKRRRRKIVLRRKRRRKNLRLKLFRSPIPKKFVTKLKFYQQNSLNPGAAGIPAVTLFRGNSLFDPDYSGAGAQPRGFDQFMTMFDHYVVIGSKIKVRFSASTQLSEPLVVGITKRDGVNQFVNKVDYQEYAYNKSRLLSPGDATRGYGYTPPIITMIGTNRFLGRSKPLSDPELKGSASTNPTEQWFYHVYAYPLSSNDTAACNAEIWIEYTAVFIEPKLPAQS